VALTPIQKKWAVGGTIAVAAFAVSYGIFHSRPAHAGLLPGEHPGHVGHPGHSDHGRHEHRHKLSRSEDRGGHSQENERGEYGRKKHHHHREHKHG
jgi:hypothetical protein